MKKLFFLLIALLLFFGCAQPVQQPPTKEVQQPAPTAKNGILRVSLTDEEAIGYENLWVTISSIEVHREGVWESVFSGSKTFDLLKLSGVKELIGEKELAVGKYTQVRMGVTKVELVELLQTEPVEVPSEKIKLVKEFEVKANQLTEIVIDFDPYSVVRAGEKYILKPVIKVLSLSEFNEKAAQAKKQKEETMEEKARAKILQLAFPVKAETGQTITVSYRVVGGLTGNIEHTAVHWDTVGGKGENTSEYANRSEILQGKTPQDFDAKISLPQVTQDSSIFFRAHAIVDGQYVYSPEQEIRVLAAKAPEQTVEEFSAMVNDSRFEPKSITVKNGSLVKITFNVETANVSFGGMDIRSSEFETGTIAPGESKQVQFTAKQGFTVTGYWPKSSNRKGDLQVNVTE